MLEHVEYAKPKAVLTLETVLCMPAGFSDDLTLSESHFPLAEGTLARGKDSGPPAPGSVGSVLRQDHTARSGCGTPRKVLSGEPPPAGKYYSCRR